MINIETYHCPLCGKEAMYYIGKDVPGWNWHHSCNGIFIKSEISFFEEKDAKEDWGIYCTNIQHQLDFNYTYGFREGYHKCRMDHLYD